MTPSPRRAWTLGLSLPLIGAVWVLAVVPWLAPAAAEADALTRPLSTTWIGVVVILVAAIAWYTDGRTQRLPNWLTYSATLWGLLLNGASELVANPGNWIGAVGLGPSLLGLLMLFTLFLVVFSFTGGGAGDVKLAGAVGALLGFDAGCEAMLYAFLAAGVMIPLAIAWRQGALNTVRLTCRALGSRFFPAQLTPLTAEERSLLQAPVALGPFFAVGMLAVVCLATC